MNQPLVSVIIATKNSSLYLPEAIKSVLSQEYKNFEIIIVDGGSTDKTEEIARSYKEVRFILQSGSGIYDAWNLGLSLARGELIAFIDSDDIWTPDKLRLQVEYLLVHPEVQYVIAKLKYFLHPGCPIPRTFRKEFLNGEHVGPIPPALMARKSLFDQIGGFDVSMKIASDTDWFVRAKDLRIPMAVIPAVLLHKRVHNTNTALADVTVNNREILEVFRRSIGRNKIKKDMDG